MRRFLIAAAAVCGLCLGVVSVRAADKDKEIHGVLIDNMCGAKQLDKSNPEEAAKGHPKSCAMKESCSSSGFGVVSGKKLIKFDDAGNAKAKEYLGVKENATKVVVVGTMSDDGKTLNVKEIRADKKST